MKRLSCLKVSFLLLFFSLFFLFPKSVSAQTVNNQYGNVSSENIPTLTQEVTISVLSSLSCQITGINPINKNPHSCLGIDPKTNKVGYVQNSGGMIGVMGNMIAMTYTPPIHTNQFVAYMKGNFGIVKSANAQVNKSGQTPCDTASGIGYCGLTPLLGVWKAFRDLAFLVFTVLFTLIGAAVMLRIKVDPRTVMTLENQIPRVIIGLVLISFSFAIAGLLIDLMYVGIYVVFSFFSQPSLYPDKEKAAMLQQIIAVQNSFQGSTPFGTLDTLVSTTNIPGSGMAQIVGGASGSAGDMVGSIFYVEPQTQTVASFFTLGWINLLQNLVTYLLSWIATIAVFLVLAIALLVALFRVWFALLYAYIYILIDVMIAPLWIMAGIMPGSSMNFESWLRDMMARLAAFPTVIAMFLVGRFFMYAFMEQGDRLFIAPLIGNPMRNNVDVQPLSSLIAIGVVLMTPAAVTMMSEFFKAPTFKWTATAFQQVGAGAGVPSKIGSGVMNYGFGTHYDAHGGHGSRWGELGGVGTALKAIGLVH